MAEKKKPAPRNSRQEYATLEFTARIKEALASAFNAGRYPPPIQAFLEFTDNSFAYRNRNKSRPATVITATIEPDRTSVLDVGGEGGDRENIRHFLRAGQTQGKGISHLGVGAKCAVWYFGRDLRIRAKLPGEIHEDSVSIKGFGDPKIKYRGRVPVPRTASSALKGVGLFEIEVKRIHPDRVPKMPRLIKDLGEVYRPLLISATNPNRSRKVITSNGALQVIQDKVVIRIKSGSKVKQVEPLAIPLIDGSEEKIHVVRTNDHHHNEVLWFWFGQMDENHPDARHVKPGVRFYYDGRLVTINFCGHPEKDPRLQNLVAEVHLDHIQGIKKLLSLNKSAGIDTNSKEWHRVEKALKKSPLGTYIKALLQQPIESLSDKPKFFDNLVRDIKALLQESIQDLRGNRTVSKDVLRSLNAAVGLSPIGLKGTVFRREKKLKRISSGAHGGGGPRGERKIRRKGHPPGLRSGEETTGGDGGELEPAKDELIKKVTIEKGKGTYPHRFINGVLYFDMNNPLVKTKLQTELTTMVMIGEGVAEVLAQQVATTPEEQNTIKKQIIRALGEQITSHNAYRSRFASS